MAASVPAAAAVAAATATAAAAATAVAAAVAAAAAASTQCVMGQPSSSHCRSTFSRWTWRGEKKTKRFLATKTLTTADRRTCGESSSPLCRLCQRVSQSRS